MLYNVAACNVAQLCTGYVCESTADFLGAGTIKLAWARAP